MYGIYFKMHKINYNSVANKLGILKLICVQCLNKTLQIGYRMLIKIFKLIKFKDLYHHFKDNKFINFKINRKI
jgi:hypothetical protein